MTNRPRRPDFIHQEFKKAGYITENRPLKLHCTILNTSHRRPRRREPFSYEDVLKSSARQLIGELTGILFGRLVSIPFRAEHCRCLIQYNGYVKLFKAVLTLICSSADFFEPRRQPRRRHKFKYSSTISEEDFPPVASESWDV